MALACDAYLREGGQRTDAVFVRVQEKGEARSRLFAQRYRSRPFAAVGNWVLVGDDAPLLPPAPDPAGSAPSEALRTYLAQCVDLSLEWVRFGDGSGAESFEEGQPLFSPTLLHPGEGGTITNRFALGSLPWAALACAKSLAEKPALSLAVFVYDDVATLDGQPSRQLVFRAHERATPASFVFSQAYATPRRGQPFATTGPLQPRGTAGPMFQT